MYFLQVTSTVELSCCTRKDTTFFISLIFLQAIVSQKLVNAEWQSSLKELSQLEAETALTMALLDPTAVEMGKRGREGENCDRKGNKKRRKTGINRVL